MFWITEEQLLEITRRGVGYKTRLKIEAEVRTQSFANQTLKFSRIALTKSGKSIDTQPVFPTPE